MVIPNATTKNNVWCAHKINIGLDEIIYTQGPITHVLRDNKIALTKIADMLSQVLMTHAYINMCRLSTLLPQINEAYI